MVGLVPEYVFTCVPAESYIEIPVKALEVQFVDGFVIFVTLNENTDPAVMVDDRVSVAVTKLLDWLQETLVRPVPLFLVHVV